MSTGNHGKQFEKDILRSLRTAGHWAERFRDNTWNSMAGSNESPPDMIAVVNKKPILLELKAITTGRDGDGDSRPLIKGAISTKRCLGHQLKRLIDFEKKHGGMSFIGVMYYTPRAQSRCAVMIPVDYWTSSPDLYGRGTVRLSDLRRDIHPSLHMKWVGRKAEIGPYQVCHTLGESPDKDVTVVQHVEGRHIPR